MRESELGLQLHLVLRQDETDHLPSDKLLPLGTGSSLFATALARDVHHLQRASLRAPLNFDLHKCLLLVVVQFE